VLRTERIFNVEKKKENGKRYACISVSLRNKTYVLVSVLFIHSLFSDPHNIQDYSAWNGTVRCLMTNRQQRS